MIRVDISNLNNKYKLEDIPSLKKENKNLVDMIIEMIEVGVENGDYEKQALTDEQFIDGYLLDELNGGCIKVSNELSRDSYKCRVERLRSAIEGHRNRLENVFDFITLNHGEGNIDFIEHSFEYEGIGITNPFMDETLRVDVDPISYYGAVFVQSKIADMILDYCKGGLYL